MKPGILECVNNKISLKTIINKINEIIAYFSNYFTKTESDDLFHPKGGDASLSVVAKKATNDNEVINRKQLFNNYIMKNTNNVIGNNVDVLNLPDLDTTITLDENEYAYITLDAGAYITFDSDTSNWGWYNIELLDGSSVLTRTIITGRDDGTSRWVKGSASLHYRLSGAGTYNLKARLKLYHGNKATGDTKCENAVLIIDVKG